MKPGKILLHFRSNLLPTVTKLVNLYQTTRHQSRKQWT